MSYKVRDITLASKPFQLIGYNAQGREEGYHEYQAVLWPDRSGNWWSYNGEGNYLVCKEPGGPWLMKHLEQRHTIYLGRTLKEAWAMIQLIYSS